MKVKFGASIGIAIGVLIAFGLFVFPENQTDEKESIVFHETLANPQKYENGIYSNSFEIDGGTYEIRFVPNGDSPKKLTISLTGQSVSFIENFILEGTPHETGVSIYYTWEYLGEKIIEVSSHDEVEILINPNGNLLGPVSIDIMKK